MKLSLVIPCFNESKSIKSLVDKCLEFNAYQDVEIIFVDNGSQDDTLEKLQKYTPAVTKSKLVHLHKNMGYGGGILEGIKKTTGAYVGWTHADLQCNPLDALKAYRCIKKEKKFFYKGKRFGRPFFDIFFTLGMSYLESFLFKCKLRDINAQPTIFHRDLFQKYAAKAPNDFSLDLYFYVLAIIEKYSVFRFPVHFGKRNFGKSSWNNGIISRLNFIKRTLRFSFKLKKIITNDHN